jgi:hypothetical protein
MKKNIKDKIISILKYVASMEKHVIINSLPFDKPEVIETGLEELVNDGVVCLNGIGQYSLRR